MSYKKILSLDFDGVLHSYKSGWKGARTIPDPPVEGAIEWLESFLSSHCTVPDSICAMAPEGDWEVCIFSSRSCYIGGRRAMKKWLVANGLDSRYLEVIKFPLHKPPATVGIDDRVLTFNGQFPSFAEIITFKPWNKK